jgi:hypothetical protein
MASAPGTSSAPSEAPANDARIVAMPASAAIPLESSCRVRAVRRPRTPAARPAGSAESQSVGDSAAPRLEPVLPVRAPVAHAFEGDSCRPDTPRICRLAALPEASEELAVHQPALAAASVSRASGRLRFDEVCRRDRLPRALERASSRLPLARRSGSTPWWAKGERWTAGDARGRDALPRRHAHADPVARRKRSP